MSDSGESSGTDHSTVRERAAPVAGWYRAVDPRGARRYWDGASWTGATAVAAGWFIVGSAQGGQRHWDGSRWDTQVAGTPSPTLRRTVWILAAAMAALLAWGTAAFITSPARRYPADQRNYYCWDQGGGHLEELVRGQWLPWLGVLGVVGVATYLRRRHGTSPSRAVVTVGIILVLVLCPLWLILALGADCAL